MAGFERGDARRVDVETNDLAMLAKFHGQRQADVTQANDSELDVRNIVHHAHKSWVIPAMSVGGHRVLGM